jgi:hypothetical protein
MPVYMGPLRWYGFKRFSTIEQANMHQALLAMQGVYTTVKMLADAYILIPATENEIADLLKQVDSAEAK